MSTRNIQSLPCQIIAKQKQAIRLKQSQLSQKFRWLSKYLTPDNDQNIDEQNIIAKSIKFYHKGNNRVKTQINTRLTKKQQLLKTANMQIFCGDTIKQNLIRPLTSHKHIKQNSLIIEPIKSDKMRGRSFLLHNFNSTNIGKVYSRKSYTNKTVTKERRNEEITKKTKKVIEQKFLLSPWDVQFSGKQNKENNFLIDQIALL